MGSIPSSCHVKPWRNLGREWLRVNRAQGCTSLHVPGVPVRTAEPAGYPETQQTPKPCKLARGARLQPAFVYHLLCGHQRDQVRHGRARAHIAADRYFLRTMLWWAFNATLDAASHHALPQAKLYLHNELMVTQRGHVQWLSSPPLVQQSNAARPPQLRYLTSSPSPRVT